MISTTLPAATRRTFLKRAVSTTGALAALAAFGSRVASADTYTSVSLHFADVPGTGDVKVLNYALLLEALETSLYKRALERLTDGGDAPTDRKVGGLHLPASSAAVQYVKEFGKVETEHRDYIDHALGNASAIRHPPFSRLVFDFGFDFMTAAEVVNLVYVAEKTGVGAYLGAISKLATKTYLQLAGAILGTEARHTAVVAQIIDEEFNGTLNVAPLYTDNHGIDKPVTPDAVLKAVSPFIKLHHS